MTTRHVTTPEEYHEAISALQDEGWEIPGEPHVTLSALSALPPEHLVHLDGPGVPASAPICLARSPVADLSLSELVDAAYRLAEARDPRYYLVEMIEQLMGKTADEIYAELALFAIF